MHFGFALELSDIDLWNTDLLDTHLGLLNPKISIQISPVSILFVSIKSLRGLQDMSSRHLQDMSSRRLQDMSRKRLEDVFKTNKCLLGIFISEKFKGSCEIYFKSDIAEFEFDYRNKIKLKTSKKYVTLPSFPFYFLL